VLCTVQLFRHGRWPAREGKWEQGQWELKF
jgi:hypothetical protein